MRWGRSFERYNSLRLYREAHHYRDVLHGLEREFDEHGQVQQESEYEYGIQLSQRTYHPDGTLKTFTQLSEDDAAFAYLQELRRIFKELEATEGGRDGS